MTGRCVQLVCYIFGRIRSGKKQLTSTWNAIRSAAPTANHGRREFESCMRRTWRSFFCRPAAENVSILTCILICRRTGGRRRPSTFFFLRFSFTYGTRGIYVSSRQCTGKTTTFLNVRRLFLFFGSRNVLSSRRLMEKIITYLNIYIYIYFFFGVDAQGYPGDEDMGGGASANFAPPAKESSTSPRGHRRHASFDPNTDCFPQHYPLGTVGGGRGDAPSR